MTPEVINQILNVASVVILAWLGYRYKLQSDKQALDATAAAAAQKEATEAAKAAAVAAASAEKKAEVTSKEVTHIKEVVNSERTETLLQNKRDRDEHQARLAEAQAAHEAKLDKALSDYKTDMAGLAERLIQLTSRNAVLEEIIVPTATAPPTADDGSAK